MKGKVAVITGAARGIGRATALELARRGADVVLNDYQQIEEAEGVAGEIVRLGRRALVHKADVSSREAMEGLFGMAARIFGRVDIVVANAARNVRKPLLELTVEDVEATWGVTQWGVFHACQLGARRMVEQGEGGSIVIVSSIHSFRPYAGASAYNGAKAAVNQMARTWALELARDGIRVNVVEPGWTDTPGERGYFTEDQLAEGGKLVPLGRLAEAAEIARAAAFLASEEASYITGAVLRADGGYHLRH